MVAPVVAAALVGAGASLLGGGVSQDQQRRLMHEQMDAQREFAQHGIRWKVEDARAAGIHPLYALGASTSSYSPIAVQDQLGPAISSAGQDISRAMTAQATAEERQANEATMFMLEAERRSDARILAANADARENRRLALAETEATIRNMVLLDQLNRGRAPGTGPGLPRTDTAPPDSLAPGRDPRVSLKRAEQVARSPHDSSHTAASQPMWTKVETAPGVFRKGVNTAAVEDADLWNAYLSIQGAVDQIYSELVGGPHYLQNKSRQWWRDLRADWVPTGVRRSWTPGQHRKGM